jgi:hypothetical protein
MTSLSRIMGALSIACCLSSATLQPVYADCAYIQTIPRVAGYAAGNAAAYVANLLGNLAPAPGAACRQLIGLVGPDTLSLGAGGVAVQFPALAFPDLVNRGRLPYATIDNVRQTLLAAPVVAPPLFSIIDSNAAHHFTEPLTRLVFQGSARPRAIVQIDQHPDITGGPIADIDCTNWGRYALNAARYPAGAIPAPPNPAAATHEAVYIWVGPAAPPAAGNFTVKSYVQPNAVAATANTGLAGLGAAVLLAINNALHNPADFDVYVSVDRDFHAYGATGWDVYGKHDPATAHQAVQSIVNQFPAGGAGGHLRGFDVVGMAVTNGPVDAAVYQGLHLLPSDQNKRAQAAADVQTFWAAAHARLRL